MTKKNDIDDAVALLRPTTDASFVNLVEHERQQAETQEMLDKARPELLKCLNHAYASAREAEKPVYEWEVSAKWLGVGDDGLANFDAGPLKVFAQDDATAWARFCDQLEVWPSRRDAKPIIKRGKQLTSAQVVAMTVSDVDSLDPTPTIRLGKKKSRAH